MPASNTSQNWLTRDAGVLINSLNPNLPLNVRRRVCRHICEAQDLFDGITRATLELTNAFFRECAQYHLRQAGYLVPNPILPLPPGLFNLSWDLRNANTGIPFLEKANGAFRFRNNLRRTPSQPHPRLSALPLTCLSGDQAGLPHNSSSKYTTGLFNAAARYVLQDPTPATLNGRSVAMQHIWAHEIRNIFNANNIDPKNPISKAVKAARTLSNDKRRRITEHISIMMAVNTKEAIIKSLQPNLNRIIQSTWGQISKAGVAVDDLRYVRSAIKVSLKPVLAFAGSRNRVPHDNRFILTSTSPFYFPPNRRYPRQFKLEVERAFAWMQRLLILPFHHLHHGLNLPTAADLLPDATAAWQFAGIHTTWEDALRKPHNDAIRSLPFQELASQLHFQYNQGLDGQGNIVLPEKYSRIEYLVRKSKGACDSLDLDYRLLIDHVIGPAMLRRSNIKRLKKRRREEGRQRELPTRLYVDNRLTLWDHTGGIPRRLWPSGEEKGAAREAVWNSLISFKHVPQIKDAGTLVRGQHPGRNVQNPNMKFELPIKTFILVVRKRGIASFKVHHGACTNAPRALLQLASQNRVSSILTGELPEIGHIAPRPGSAHPARALPGAYLPLMRGIVAPSDIAMRPQPNQPLPTFEKTDLGQFNEAMCITENFDEAVASARLARTNAALLPQLPVFQQLPAVVQQRIVWHLSNTAKHLLKQNQKRIKGGDSNRRNNASRQAQYRNRKVSLDRQQPGIQEVENAFRYLRDVSIGNSDRTLYTNARHAELSQFTRIAKFNRRRKDYSMAVDSKVMSRSQLRNNVAYYARKKTKAELYYCGSLRFRPGKQPLVIKHNHRKRKGATRQRRAHFEAKVPLRQGPLPIILTDDGYGQASKGRRGVKSKALLREFANFGCQVYAGPGYGTTSSCSSLFPFVRHADLFHVPPGALPRQHVPQVMQHYQNLSTNHLHQCKDLYEPRRICRFKQHKAKLARLPGMKKMAYCCFDKTNGGGGPLHLCQACPFAQWEWFKCPRLKACDHAQCFIPRPEQMTPNGPNTYFQSLINHPDPRRRVPAAFLDTPLPVENVLHRGIATAVYDRDHGGARLNAAVDLYYIFSRGQFLAFNNHGFRPLQDLNRWNNVRANSNGDNYRRRMNR